MKKLVFLSYIVSCKCLIQSRDDANFYVTKVIWILFIYKQLLKSLISTNNMKHILYITKYLCLSGISTKLLFYLLFIFTSYITMLMTCPVMSLTSPILFSAQNFTNYYEMFLTFQCLNLLVIIYFDCYMH